MTSHPSSFSHHPSSSHSHPSAFLPPPSKKILKAISLELRHLLEGHYDSGGKWQPGDLEQRLAAIGVRRDREPVPVDELAHLSDDDKNARTVVDAYLQLRDEADVSREEAVAEFVRETAYTWANRLLCLRCMEARELIDEVILQKEAYGGRSLEHHRLAQREPEVCSGEDDGLFAMLEKVFTDQTEHLPLLFDPQSPGVALKPSPAVLKRCLALLSGIEAVRSQDPATAEVFQAPDALGWAYQYWNTEEKDRVFETVRTKKGTKIAGADVIPATQLYTEPYMVKFLVQNSLGATWMGMHADSKLYENWEYYVRDADREDIEKKPIAEITFLDPACGSGHFLIEAFDLYYDMYEEEGRRMKDEGGNHPSSFPLHPSEICRSILEKNLFGIDIDARAVQIAEAALWMKAAERAFDFQGRASNLVAAVASHLKGELWERFLAGFEREPSVSRVLQKFGHTMEHIDELGSLARPEEALQAIIHEEHDTWERQVREKAEANFLFPEMVEDAVSGHLPFQEISDEEFGDRLLYRARAAIDAFSVKAREEAAFHDQFLGHETSEGFRLFGVLSGEYDIVAANPPYMGRDNFSETVRQYLNDQYKPCSADLYSAFLHRCHLLTSGNNGTLAFVSPQSWYTLVSFEALRVGMLPTHRPFRLVGLGQHVFDEAPLLYVALSVLRSDSDVALTMDLSSYQDKQSGLLEQCRNTSFEELEWCEVDGLESKLLLFNLPPKLRNAIREGPFLGSIADCKVGLQTGDNNRYIRFWWEVLCGSFQEKHRWHWFVKSSGFNRWWTPLSTLVDWQAGGFRIKQDASSRPQNEPFYHHAGIGCSMVSGGRLSGKLCERAIFDNGTVLSIPNSGQSLAAMHLLLNSNVANVLLNGLSPTLNYSPGYFTGLPVPSDLDGDFAEHISKLATELTKEFYEFDETCFACRLEDGGSLREFLQRTHARLATTKQQLMQVTREADVAVTKSFGANPESLAIQGVDVRIETGLPEGAKLIGEPNVGPDAKWIAEVLSSVFSTIVLRLSGVRWPQQVEAGEPEPEWADPDGIIPLVEGTDEPALIERFRQRIAVEFEAGGEGVIERDFAEILGKPLEKWLTMEFFKLHAKQFKKRPVVWQIQSGKFTARKKPAFACLVYYHKLDGDLLPKIRNQYVGPLRSRLETELRSIESVSADARSDRQEGRRVELQDQSDELRDFDATLQKVITEGFNSKELTKIVKDEPLDKWCSLDGSRPEPESQEALLQQESRYFPDINDGVRVNIAPLQKAGLLAAPVLSKKDLDKAIADRAQWRADERRWCREDKLPQPGWWPEEPQDTTDTQTQGAERHQGGNV